MQSYHYVAKIHSGPFWKIPVLIWVYKEDFCGMEEKLNQSKQIYSKGISYMIEREEF